LTSSRILLFVSLLAIVVLQYCADPPKLGPDVEECLNDERDIVVRDHAIRVTGVGGSSKTAAPD
jgi:hypothetical protein